MFNIKYRLFLITKLHLSSVNNKNFLLVIYFIFFQLYILWNIEQCSPCHTVGPCWLPILNIAMCAHLSQTPNLSLPTSLLP